MKKEAVRAASASPPARPVDVAVCGAGLVGQTVAAGLARLGLSVALVERAPRAALLAPSHDGRTSAIALGSKRLLEAAGIWQHVGDAAEPILEIRVSDGEAPLFLHYDHADVGDEPMGWIVENAVLRRAGFAALDALPGVELIAGVEVADLVQAGETRGRGRAGNRGPGRVQLALSDGSRLSARLAIGADGRGSALRRMAGIGVRGWPYHQTALVLTAHHRDPHGGIAHERFLPAGPFAILPMKDAHLPQPGQSRHRSSIVWTETAHEAKHLLALEAAGERRRVEAALAERFGDFLGPVGIAGDIWSYPLSAQQATAFHAGRVVLVGDAAHGIHPIAGQGFNLGIRDAASLAARVAEPAGLGLDIGAPDVLAAYARERWPDNLSMLAVTDQLNRLFSNRNPVLRGARDLGLALVNAAPPVRRSFQRHAMGLPALPRSS